MITRRNALVIVASVAVVALAAWLLRGQLRLLFDSSLFMPHGHCYLWRPAVVWMHVIADSIIFLAYLSISSTLVYFILKRPDLPFDWMFAAFGVFVLSCGIGHLIDVVTLWTPVYWFSGAQRGLTAFVSIVTAITLIPLVPKALALPSPAALRAEIAERKAAEAELVKAHEALLRSEKLAAVGQLAASIGHELRNPLSAVRNAMTFVMKRMPTHDPKVKQFFDLMDHELTSCGKIISGLLDFARERPLSRQPSPLRALVSEAAGLVDRGEVPVENGVPEELPIPEIDRDQFRQVLINLIENAVDASRESKKPVQIEASHGEAGWTVVVRDEGVGIAEDVIGKIFEPLFTAKMKGTGLGLAIVRNIVKAHGGQIEVSSKVGLGTIFTVTLPRTA